MEADAAQQQAVALAAAHAFVAADAEDITTDVAAAAQLAVMVPSLPLPAAQTDNCNGSSDAAGADAANPSHTSLHTEGSPVNASCGSEDSPQPESDSQVETEVHESSSPREEAFPAAVIESAESDGLLQESRANADPEAVQPVANLEQTPSSADAVCDAEESEGGVSPDDRANIGESRSRCTSLAAHETTPSVNGHADSSSVKGTPRTIPEAALINEVKAAEVEELLDSA